MTYTALAQEEPVALNIIQDVEGYNELGVVIVSEIISKVD
jgi:hypothetical protein